MGKKPVTVHPRLILLVEGPGGVPQFLIGLFQCEHLLKLWELRLLPLEEGLLCVEGLQVIPCLLQVGGQSCQDLHIGLHLVRAHELSGREVTINYSKRLWLTVRLEGKLFHA